MKTIMLTATALAMMTMSCYGQVRAAISGSAEARARIDKQAQDQNEAQQAFRRAETAAKKLFESSVGLFGTDKRWNDGDFAGTFGNRPVTEFKVGDWGRTSAQFQVLNKVSNTEFLATAKNSDGRVVLVRGLDSSKVTDGVEFVIPYVMVIPGTYEYKAVSGARKTVLVLERNESRVDEIVAKERERRAAEDPKNQIETAKKRLWNEQPVESQIVVGECPTISGDWWNGAEGEGRQTMTIVQSNKDNVITINCSYLLPNRVPVRWRVSGTISDVGHVTGRLIHTKAPKGFANQTWIAVVSPDGKRLTGRAVFDTVGGHDFVWNKIEEPTSRASDAEVAAKKLQLAKAFVDKDDKSNAKRRLQEIIDEYPNTPAAEQSEGLLKKLK